MSAFGGCSGHCFGVRITSVIDPTRKYDVPQDRCLAIRPSLRWHWRNSSNHPIQWSKTLKRMVIVLSRMPAMPCVGVKYPARPMTYRRHKRHTRRRGYCRAVSKRLGVMLRSQLRWTFTRIIYPTTMKILPQTGGNVFLGL